jgi:hypothetical protein
MDTPYYVSPPKVAHILGSSSVQIRQQARSAELSATLGVSELGLSNLGVSAKVGTEASPVPIGPDVAHMLAFVKDAVKVLGRLPAADDPTLSFKDWFVFEGSVRFRVLSRDSGPDVGKIAVWIAEQVTPALGMASWVVLTGTPDHLDEAWTGTLSGNRSGSGTEAVFDALRAAGADLPSGATEPSDKEVFYGVSDMAGMLARPHRVRAVAQVLDVRTWRDSQCVTSGGVPIVRVVVASPLCVTAVQNRPASGRQGRSGAGGKGWWASIPRRMHAHLGRLRWSRRKEAGEPRPLLSAEGVGDQDEGVPFPFAALDRPEP